jgi:hypothetical protein
MKVKELFKPTHTSHSIHGLVIFLDRENCQVVNKTKNEDSILLHLKRESDGEEGRTYLRVRDEFEDIASLLLKHIFANIKIIGLTLNQLDDFETGLSFEKVDGRNTIKISSKQS